MQYNDESRFELPDVFTRLPDLTRSVSDIGEFHSNRKLALIKDILDTLDNSDTDSGYFIYTNVDIALMPGFYLAIKKIIEKEYDAFVINRRTIKETFTSIDQIPLMYAETGETHPGYDCFVFKRNIYEKFILRDICIGTAWIGRALLANMVAFSKNFKEFRNLHLTFHLGDSLSWRDPDFDEYFKHNRDEYRKIYRDLKSHLKNFDDVWESYLLDGGAKRMIPVFD